jgi:hypothetical protein
METRAVVEALLHLVVDKKHTEREREERKKPRTRYSTQEHTYILLFGRFHLPKFPEPLKIVLLPGDKCFIQHMRLWGTFHIQTSMMWQGNGKGG